MKVGFIITSALNTKFGVYTAEERLAQTLDTIKSVRSRCNESHITIIEMGGGGLKDEQRDILQQHCDLVVDFTEDPTVQQVFKSDNWDVVKSFTELLCVGEMLKRLDSHPAYKDITRVFKLSGRYVLTDDFALADYSNDKLLNSIVVATKKYSQFSPAVTNGCTYQYMSRCWSFPRDMLLSMAETYKSMLDDMIARVKAGGYLDVEHLLYKFLPPDQVSEKEIIGVQGNLGPNGILVKD